MRTKLDVVNSCLKSVGESPVLSLTDDHPLIQAAQSTLDQVMIQQMSRRWWFNTDWVNLVVGPTGQITVPADAVDIQIPGDSGYSIRGNLLYDRYNSTFTIGKSVEGWVVRKLPFEHLPAIAQAYIENQTVLNFQTNYDADQTKLVELKQMVADSFLTLRAEEIRQVSYNRLDTGSVAVRRARIYKRGSGNIPIR